MPKRYAEAFSFVPRRGRELLVWLDPRPGERILDLGCGTGALTAAIGDAGADVEGIDQDPAMLALARREHPGVAFRRADAQRLRVAEPLDAVFSNAALHWMPDQDAVIAAVARALRPGGRFVVEMGGRRNIAAILAPLRAALEREGLPVARQPQPWVLFRRRPSRRRDWRRTGWNCVGCPPSIGRRPWRAALTACATGCGCSRGRSWRPCRPTAPRR